MRINIFIYPAHSRNSSSTSKQLSAFANYTHLPCRTPHPRSCPPTSAVSKTPSPHPSARSPPPHELLLLVLPRNVKLHLLALMLVGFLLVLPSSCVPVSWIKVHAIIVLLAGLLLALPPPLLHHLFGVMFHLLALLHAALLLPALFSSTILSFVHVDFALEKNMQNICSLPGQSQRT